MTTKILLFGGTTEGREIADSGLPVFYSVTTDYGAELADFPTVEPVVGRMVTPRGYNLTFTL